MNVYRERYDIPIDLMVRKPDPDITASVKSSETIRKVVHLDMTSISPQLIFFTKHLPEHMIQACVKRLHGEGNERKHIYLLQLREVNAMLAGGHPQIGLMFGPFASTYSHSRVPGFISVPANFKSTELLEYTKTNI